MNNSQPHPALRLHAEAMLRSVPAATELPQPCAPLADQELLHELRLHQIELELQNDELRRAQAALEESRQRYLDLYDHAPVGYCTVSSTGLVLNANLTMTALLGLATGILKLQQFARFIAHEDRDGYYLFSRKMFTGHDLGPCELRMLKSDGTPFWAKLQANVSSGSIGAPVLRLVVTDVSERRATAMALAQACDQAQAASSAKSTFLANISHEIRTPMNAILGFSQLMLNGATPEQAQRLSRIHAAGRHLLAIVNDVLDLAKIDAGRMQFEGIDFDLHQVLSEVAAMVEEQARGKGLALQISAHDVPRMLRGDPTRLRQALLNFVSNAVKFTSRGGVALEASVVTDAPDGIIVRLSVTDTGEGIAPDRLALLFEPFVQVDSSVTRRHGGTGLGLAITRRLAELMGGEVGAQSQPGVGSEFWLTARLRRVEQAEPERAMPSDAELSAQLALRCAGMTVLVVDDDEVCREIHGAMLNHAGVKVDLAADGIEAVQLAATGRYGLILMDMQMPGMDGLSAARAIRRLHNGAALGVIGLTANADGLDRRDCAQAGMQTVLGKPLEPRALYQAMLAHITGSADPGTSSSADSGAAAPGGS